MVVVVRVYVREGIPYYQGFFLILGITALSQTEFVTRKFPLFMDHTKDYWHGPLFILFFHSDVPVFLVGSTFSLSGWCAILTRSN